MPPRRETQELGKKGPAEAHQLRDDSGRHFEVVVAEFDRSLFRRFLIYLYVGLKALFVGLDPSFLI